MQLFLIHGTAPHGAVDAIAESGTSSLTHGHSCKRNYNHCEDVVTGGAGLLPDTCGKTSFVFQHKSLAIFACCLI